MQVKRMIAALAFAGSLGTSPLIATAATVAVPSTEDFFTTRWAFAAPYVRGLNEPARAGLGVTTPNPFLTDSTGTGNNTWEETTYFVFDDFAALAPTQAVASATLSVRMVARPGGDLPSATTPFAVSAHRVTGDPLSIDGTTINGAGGYVEFKNGRVGAAEDTVVVATAAASIFSWDVTDLVNEWIANGDAAFDYSIAMTGRLGNAADTASTGFFHAFDNRESAAAQFPARLTLTPVPEPTTVGLAVAGLVALTRRR